MSGSGPRAIDTLLAAYAAGTLSEPFAVLAASHLQMKADNRAYIAGREAADSAPLNAIVPVLNPSHERWPISAVEQMNIFMPLALRSYVSRHLGVLEWSTILPGLKQCQIARDAGGDASFLRCRPGKAIPAHTHKGLEAVLVLQGGFRDENSHYAPGDIAVADDTIDHRPVADRSAECIIFVVLEAPVQLTGLFGRLIQSIFHR